MPQETFGSANADSNKDKPLLYEVVVIKRRTGEEIRGVMQDDGLQSLWPVWAREGEPVRYVSVLDTFVSKVECA